jgi:hypothetical protein
MKRASSGLTYANVISTICLFLLLGGGAAFAASQLGKNSVGSKQLKKNSVTTAKIKNGAVTTEKITDGAVTGAKVLDGSLTGADINQSTLTSVRASNVTAIQISGDGNCTPVVPLPAGVTTSHPGGGTCKFTFPSPITSCTESATVHLRNNKALIIIAAPRTAWIFENASEPNVLYVDTFLGEGKSDQPFDLIITC